MPRYLGRDYLTEHVTDNLQFLQKTLLTVPTHLEHGNAYIHTRKTKNDNFSLKSLLKEFDNHVIDEDTTEDIISDWKTAISTSSTKVTPLESYDPDEKSCNKNIIEIDSDSDCFGSSLGSTNMEDTSSLHQEIVDSVLSKRLGSSVFKTKEDDWYLEEPLEDMSPLKKCTSISTLCKRLRPVGVSDPFAEALFSKDTKLEVFPIPKDETLVQWNFEKIKLDKLDDFLLEEIPFDNEDDKVLVKNTEVQMKSANVNQVEQLERVEPLDPEEKEDIVSVISDMQPTTSHLLEKNNEDDKAVEDGDNVSVISDIQSSTSCLLEKNNKGDKVDGKENEESINQTCIKDNSLPDMLESPKSPLDGPQCNNAEDSKNTCEIPKDEVVKDMEKMDSSSSNLESDKQLLNEKKENKHMLHHLLPEPEENLVKFDTSFFKLPALDTFEKFSINEEDSDGLVWDPIPHADDSFMEAAQNLFKSDFHLMEVKTELNLKDIFQFSFIPLNLDDLSNDMMLANCNDKEEKVKSLKHLVECKTNAIDDGILSSNGQTTDLNNENCKDTEGKVKSLKSLAECKIKAMDDGSSSSKDQKADLYNEMILDNCEDKEEKVKSLENIAECKIQSISHGMPTSKDKTADLNNEMMLENCKEIEEKVESLESITECKSNAIGDGIISSNDQITDLNNEMILENCEDKEEKVKSLENITECKSNAIGDGILSSKDQIAGPVEYHKNTIQNESSQKVKDTHKNVLPKKFKQPYSNAIKPLYSKPSPSPLDSFMLLRTGKPLRPKSVILPSMKSVSVVKVKPMMRETDANPNLARSVTPMMRQDDIQKNIRKTMKPNTSRPDLSSVTDTGALNVIDLEKPQFNNSNLTSAKQAWSSQNHSESIIESATKNIPMESFSRTQTVLDIKLPKEFVDIIHAIDRNSWSLMQFLKESRCIENDVKLLNLSPDLTRFILKEELQAQNKGKSNIDIYRGILCLHALVQVIDLIIHSTVPIACSVLKGYNHEHQNILCNCLEPVRKKLSLFHCRYEDSGNVHPKFIKIQRSIETWLKTDESTKILILIGRYYDHLATSLQTFLSTIKDIRVNIFPVGNITESFYVSTLSNSNVILAQESADLQSCPWDYFQFVIQYEYRKESCWHETVFDINPYLKGFIALNVSQDLLNQTPVTNSTESSSNTTGIEHTILCSKEAIYDREFLVAMENKENMKLIIKDYKPFNEFLLQPDFLLDERTAICLIHADTEVNVVQQKIGSVILKCCICHIILYNPEPTNGKSFKLQSTIVSLLSQISTDFKHVQCKLWYAFSFHGLAEKCRMLSDLAFKNSKIWTKAQWKNRDWMSEAITKKEKFLLSYPCMNSFCAQILAQSDKPLSLLLGMSFEELQSCFKCVPEYILKTFFKYNCFIPAYQASNVDIDDVVNLPSYQENIPNQLEKRNFYQPYKPSVTGAQRSSEPFAYNVTEAIDYRSADIQPPNDPVIFDDHSLQPVLSAYFSNKKAVRSSNLDHDVKPVHKTAPVTIEEILDKENAVLIHDNKELFNSFNILDEVDTGKTISNSALQISTSPTARNHSSFSSGYESFGPIVDAQYRTTNKINKLDLESSENGAVKLRPPNTQSYSRSSLADISNHQLTEEMPSFRSNMATTSSDLHERFSANLLTNPFHMQHLGSNQCSNTSGGNFSMNYNEATGSGVNSKKPIHFPHHAFNARMLDSSISHQAQAEKTQYQSTEDLYDGNRSNPLWQGKFQAAKTIPRQAVKAFNVNTRHQSTPRRHISYDEACSYQNENIGTNVQFSDLRNMQGAVRWDDNQYTPSKKIKYNNEQQPPRSISLSSNKKRRLTYEKVPGATNGQTRLAFL